MSVIGMFTPTKEGGWTGSIRMLTIHAHVRFVPNDNRESERAPAFHVFIGRSRIGEAWGACSNGNSPKQYLRVQLDDPTLPKPISAALFPSEQGGSAQLIWNRRVDSTPDST
jgi:uncharacterized protein (DUF736 family)